jgi:predicted SAM-dependent methyltransferase
MLARSVKAAFYGVMGPAMAVNAMLYRALRAPRQGFVRVHLGPGQRHYLSGWINVDANMFTGRCDLWADLRQPLPFFSNSVDCFYSHHVVEHLPDLAAHLRDVFRCLKSGGAYRFGGPHGDNAIRMFQERNASWFSDFPDKRASIGGRLENFIFCRGEHLTLLTESYMRELLQGAGFEAVQPYMPTVDTGHDDLFADCLAHETEHDLACPHTLIIEARKP